MDILNILNTLSYMIAGYLFFVIVHTRESLKYRLLAPLPVLLLLLGSKLTIPSYFNVIDTADIVYIVLMYGLFKQSHDTDYEVFSVLVIEDIFSSLIFIILHHGYGIFFEQPLGYPFLAFQFIVLCMTTWFGAHFVKHTVLESTLYQELRSVLPYTLSSLLGIILLKTYFIDRMDYFTYATRVMFSLLFLLLVLLLITGIILYLRQLFKVKYQHELNQQRLSDLEVYAQHLEEGKQKLRKFKHDYNNFLIVAQGLLATQQYLQLEHYFEELSHYSMEECLQEDYLDHLHRIQHIFLKQILLEKLLQCSRQQIVCHFECCQDITELDIGNMDLIRIVGILFDNAIEATRETNNPSIDVMLYQEAHTFEMDIINTCNNTHLTLATIMNYGVSSKEGHSGIGLNTIEDIKAKYDNVITCYRKEHNTFGATLIIN